MELTTEQFVITIVVAFLLLLAVHFLWRPIRWIFVIAFNSLLGLLVLWAINFVGALVGFSLPLNLFTALVVGFLGLPGLLLLIILKYWILL
ncbi:pro-sigmaK processing inhibitor BofA [Heliorestis acidaminivorans]|uniref:Pro-sigmaK processing inhibitor BofA n=2 Tax=Heliorestis acidaminivorans TaxID=553427 RepID=A0A6I0ERX4_9FIRM|nr:pro-sigmaK processing inhibitor BofA [Heliorestis acidaminivorans]